VDRGRTRFLSKEPALHMAVVQVVWTLGCLALGGACAGLHFYLKSLSADYAAGGVFAVSFVYFYISSSKSQRIGRWP